MVPGTGIEPVRLAPRDFKSLVSTNFTIRAKHSELLTSFGGATRNRTEVHGFAGRCITTLPSRPGTEPRLETDWKQKGESNAFPLRILEREKSLELSTYTLARYRSTN
jgi:hypothetical protein